MRNFIFITYLLLMALGDYNIAVSVKMLMRLEIAHNLITQSFLQATRKRLTQTRNLDRLRPTSHRLCAVVASTYNGDP